MSNTNDFKAIGPSATIITSQSDFLAGVLPTTGFAAGIAKVEEFNKVFRQSSTIAAVVAQAISDALAVDVLDNGATAVATILANLRQASFNLRVVADFTALRALPKTGIAFALVKSTGFKCFFFDSADTSTADNGSSVIVAADGGRWKLSANFHTAAAVPTLASAGTIAPASSISFVSGVTTISTITPPAVLAGSGGQLTLIPTGLWSTNTAGNIALATAAVVNKALLMTFDATTAKWYPSY
jgi:hypothetical protein